MSTTVPAGLDQDQLREEIRKEYAQVASNPEKGFHFHTGRPLAERLGYDLAQVDALPSATVQAFAGTGNPLSLGPIEAGMRVVDVGCGAGIDSLLAALQVGPQGHVVGVDMTGPMREQAARAAEALGLAQVSVREGFAEQLPVEDGWADVVISNGVINLCPDKPRVFAELYRVLRPGGRLQIADILVSRPVPEAAKSRLELWTG